MNFKLLLFLIFNVLASGIQQIMPIKVKIEMSEKLENRVKILWKTEVIIKKNLRKKI